MSGKATLLYLKCSMNYVQLALHAARKKSISKTMQKILLTYIYTLFHISLVFRMISTRTTLYFTNVFFTGLIIVMFISHLSIKLLLYMHILELKCVLYIFLIIYIDIDV